jgi:hypothetical protein
MFIAIFFHAWPSLGAKLEIRKPAIQEQELGTIYDVRYVYHIVVVKRIDLNQTDRKEYFTFLGW